MEYLRGRSVRASGGPLGGHWGARSSLRGEELPSASGEPLAWRGVAGVFRARSTARGSLRGAELWHAAFAGVSGIVTGVS